MATVVDCSGGGGGGGAAGCAGGGGGGGAGWAFCLCTLSLRWCCFFGFLGFFGLWVFSTAKITCHRGGAARFFFLARRGLAAVLWDAKTTWPWALGFACRAGGV